MVLKNSRTLFSESMNDPRTIRSVGTLSLHRATAHLGMIRSTGLQKTTLASSHYHHLHPLM